MEIKMYKMESKSSVGPVSNGWYFLNTNGHKKRNMDNLHWSRLTKHFHSTKANNFKSKSKFLQASSLKDFAIIQFAKS